MHTAVCPLLVGRRNLTVRLTKCAHPAGLARLRSLVETPPIERSRLRRLPITVNDDLRGGVFRRLQQWTIRTRLKCELIISSAIFSRL